MVIDWPELNTLAWLRLPCCGAEHPTRIEDVHDENCVIATPVAPHTQPVAPPNAEQGFFMGWVTGTGAFEVPVELIGQSTEPILTWTVRAIGPGTETQRRQFVRLNVELDVHLQLIEGGAPTEAKTIDISEGGVRARVDRWAIDPGPRAFYVVLFLGDDEFELRAQMAWWGPESANGERAVGIKFLNLDPTIGDRIRAFIFATQLEQRRKALQ